MKFLVEEVERSIDYVTYRYQVKFVDDNGYFHYCFKQINDRGLFQTSKLTNELTKTYHGKFHFTWQKQLLFCDKAHTEAACDHLDNILLLNKIAGIEEGKAEFDNRKDEKYKNRVNKVFQRALPFKGKNCIVSTRSANERGNHPSFMIQTQIRTVVNDIVLSGNIITFICDNTILSITYASVKIKENVITLHNGDLEATLTF